MKEIRQFSHQRLLAYQRALLLATMTHEICVGLPQGFKELRGQLQRSGCAVALLTAEGANRSSTAQKRQRFVEARGECGEAAATVEILACLQAVPTAVHDRYQDVAAHVTALLTGLIKSHG